jgi:hypothetical protein
VKTNQYANTLRFFNFFHPKTEINTVAIKIKSPIKTPPPPATLASFTAGIEIMTDANPPSAANPIIPTLKSPAYPH